MNRCGKVTDPGWCATCYYRDVAGHDAAPEQDGKQVCACDQHDAPGVCWWRDRMSKPNWKDAPDTRAIMDIALSIGWIFQSPPLRKRR